MSLSYRILYALGFTRWEQAATLPALRERIFTLFQREEEGRQAPFGPVLDLGCGSGIWGVELAKRGWQVTGVDFVPKALRRARTRAQQAGVEMRLIEGDVTRLSDFDVGSDFPFPHRIRPVSRRVDRRPAPGDGPRGKRACRTRCHAADDGLGARSEGATAARRQPERHQSRLPRVGRRRRRSLRSIRSVVLPLRAESRPPASTGSATLTQGPAVDGLG
jgi:SAM-dependent methyltransferase